MAEQLTYQLLRDAVGGAAAAFRARLTLQPAGGPGDKVFPPTYAGAVYATEKRRLPGHGEPVECVLLDSVQSQANRMEEALQQAVDDGRIALPVIEVDFTPYFPGDSQMEDMRLLDPVGKIGSLQAPHRIADAILRDSLLDGQRFRDSQVGRQLDRVSLRNATPLFELCPTALLFGMWDSTGPKGGLGVKFERAMVGEIVGVDATYGLRTASRVDPIIRKNPPLYETKSGKWTALQSEALRQGPKDEPKEYPKKLSKLNLGSVTPDFVRYSSKSITPENRETVDVMLQDGDYIKGGRVSPGGVTISHAEQTLVISLPAVRRLRFPVDEQHSRERDVAGRTVLAALGLLAAALADEAGLDLRSRCLLYPEQDLTWELLDRRKGGGFTLPADQAIDVFKEAVQAAKAAGLPWRDAPVVLTPSEQLVKLVVKSQQLAAQQSGDAEESK
ncbi:MAG: type I-U CRISPR-associated protein Cas7 [Acidobacteriota bacterium]|nr:type I-U CRISPR-associated protein Cas7 [Acidobacteriota bacterium]